MSLFPFFSLLVLLIVTDLPFFLCPLAIYAEMREGLLAEDTEFATKTVKGQLKSEFFYDTGERERDAEIFYSFLFFLCVSLNRCLFCSTNLLK